uniref:C2H2-type domain-containing protein n=1 Tax=Stomoxys calcitrans TaxID=35570 RepID=A0A1I8Q1K7_STOCA
MSGTNVCRLCRSSCNDSIRLRDANGRCNEVYNIAKKYFKPKYLDVERGCSTPNAVLCMECWRHITGFNSFHQTIQLLLDNLHNDEEQTVEEESTSQEFLNAKVEESSEVITITDDFDENDAATTSTTNPMAGFSAGQLVVTDCAVQFSTDVGDILENTSGSNVIKSTEDIVPQIEEPYDIDDDFEAEGGDVFIVDEFDNWDPEAVDSVSSTDNQLVELTNRPGSPENSSSHSGTKERKTTSEIDATIAKWRPQLECHVCSGKFPTFSDVKKHFGQEHPGKEFYIACCGRKIKYRFRVEEHAAFHINPQAFQCQLCGRCFSAKCSLDGHHHFQHSLKNKNSVDTFLDKCHFCPKTFTYRTGVYQHMRAYHAEELAKRREAAINSRFEKQNHFELPPNKKKPGKMIFDICKICSKTFTYRTGLYTHMKSHHPEEFAKRNKRKR